jgi:hypothetical protein
MARKGRALPMDKLMSIKIPLDEGGSFEFDRDMVTLDLEDPVKTLKFLPDYKGELISCRYLIDAEIKKQTDSVDGKEKLSKAVLEELTSQYRMTLKTDPATGKQKALTVGEAEAQARTHDDYKEVVSQIKEEQEALYDLYRDIAIVKGHIARLQTIENIVYAFGTVQGTNPEEETGQTYRERSDGPTPRPDPTPKPKKGGAWRDEDEADPAEMDSAFVSKAKRRKR